MRGRIREVHAARARQILQLHDVQMHPVKPTLRDAHRLEARQRVMKRWSRKQSDQVGGRWWTRTTDPRRVKAVL